MMIPAPRIFLNIQSDRRSPRNLNQIPDNIFKERLQTINGVSEIRIWGSALRHADVDRPGEAGGL